MIFKTNHSLTDSMIVYCIMLKSLAQFKIKAESMKMNFSVAQRNVPVFRNFISLPV